tara:strand:- start:786 stop:1145 length:360 start_codon:yes stop_codon:yes gene_type:complete
MIYWFDSFMAIFGFKRPEVWEAERKEHDVTFPAPHAFKEPRKRSNVRSKRAGKRSQNAEGKASVRSKLLTLKDLKQDYRKCHAIYQMVDAFTDEQIAKEIGATVRAVQDYRLLHGWRRR